jgi:hypothetical protein
MSEVPVGFEAISLHDLLGLGGVSLRMKNCSCPVLLVEKVVLSEFFVNRLTKGLPNSFRDRQASLEQRLSHCTGVRGHTRSQDLLCQRR